MDRTESSPGKIVRVMDEAGIDRSVVFAMCETTRAATERAVAAMAEFPDRLIGFAYAIAGFDTNVLEDLAAAIDQGCRGIKLHAGETSLRQWVVDPLFAFAAERNVPILVDSKGDFAAIERLAATFPDAKIICAHLGNMGEAATRRIIDMAKDTENLYLDTSWVRMTHYIARAIHTSGAAKVLFGSDGPDVNVKVELFKIKVLDLPGEDEQLVLGGNILRLIGEA
ncbi:hypothetical protein LCGC14_1285330 [marine sediment metagenome]|uniref:Amidohydrolase-related domain-containing protein n=1 Tax=marine sediment metagenome TaxID=412755 RepID=A0A0F9KVP1_9ZZZZ